MRSPSASIEPLRAEDTPYFLFEFTKDVLITARFAIAADGVLLEAEGVRQATAALRPFIDPASRSEEHTSELQSRLHLVCRLQLEKKKFNWRRLRTRRPKLGSTLPVGIVRIKCTAWK